MDARHKDNCEYWHDQYPWECSCGVNKRQSVNEYRAQEVSKSGKATPLAK